jgi:hypothetical protein
MERIIQLQEEYAQWRSDRVQSGQPPLDQRERPYELSEFTTLLVLAYLTKLWYRTDPFGNEEPQSLWPEDFDGGREIGLVNGDYDISLEFNVYRDDSETVNDILQYECHIINRRDWEYMILVIEQRGSDITGDIRSGRMSLSPEKFTADIIRRLIEDETGIDVRHC